MGLNTFELNETFVASFRRMNDERICRAIDTSIHRFVRNDSFDSFVHQLIETNDSFQIKYHVTLFNQHLRHVWLNREGIKAFVKYSKHQLVKEVSRSFNRGKKKKKKKKRDLLASSIYHLSRTSSYEKIRSSRFVSVRSSTFSNQYRRWMLIRFSFLSSTVPIQRNISLSLSCPCSNRRYTAEWIIRSNWRELALWHKGRFRCRYSVDYNNSVTSRNWRDWKIRRANVNCGTSS